MDELVETRHVTLVLRLVLSQNGRVMYGELINAESGQSQHFRDRSGLTHSLDDWLNQLESSAADNAAMPSANPSDIFG